jgi:hypothetical protein
VFATLVCLGSPLTPKIILPRSPVGPKSKSKLIVSGPPNTVKSSFDKISEIINIFLKNHKEKIHIEKIIN